MRPLCFILMPFGSKPIDGGLTLDFDQVYRSIISPAVKTAGLEPIRADEEQVGGSIHKPMFERLMLCEYAVADLTGGNANVFYELGIRHALRPSSTAILFHDGTRLPFDVAPLRGLPYNLSRAEEAIASLSARLLEARARTDDSPVYQFLSDLPRPTLDHSRTDVFRDVVAYSQKLKGRIAEARSLSKVDARAALERLQHDLGPLQDVEAGVIIDLFLSYRAVGAFEQMIVLFDTMPQPLRRTRFVREQYGFALNRLGRRPDAERALLSVIGDFGVNPETQGLLGRVYKDQYEAALSGGQALLARGFLKKAIDAYVSGFEADWRDAYPGVNAVTLMELSEPVDQRQATFLPVVRFAARRAAQTRPDYWAHATLVELAALANDAEAAIAHLADALPLVPVLGETFAPRTTAKNLRLIRERRQARNLEVSWLLEVEGELEASALLLERGGSR